MVTDTPIKIQIVKSLSNLKPSRMIAVKADNESSFSLYVTDINGVPYPLKDLQGSGGITTLTNTDGNLVITGANSKVINIAPALLSVINSALQSGDNISELVNDVGYITSADLPTKTSDLINDGSDETSTYVEADELGAVAFSNDYNDLDNKPTIPTVITNHSGLSLDDGTNPHGTTKGDVGLGNVPNVDTSITSNISEGSNLYFTTARVLATVLSGLSLATGGAIVSTDTILVAFGKIQKQIDDLTTSIGNKLDKSTTADSIYATDGSGNQEMVLKSNLKDVLEFADLASFPITGENEKIYIALDLNKTYRWSGSTYVQIGGSDVQVKQIRTFTVAWNMAALDTWRGWNFNQNLMVNDAGNSYGTGTEPTKIGTWYADCARFSVNDCSKLKKLHFHVQNGGTVNSIQLFIVVADYSAVRGNETNGVIVVNETISFTSGSALKNDFSIASHSLNANSIMHIFYRRIGAGTNSMNGVQLIFDFE